MGKYSLAVLAALQGDLASVDKIMKQASGRHKTVALRSRQERRYASYKRQVRDDMIGTPWRDLPLKERAIFVSRYVWDSSKGRYGKYVKRRPPLKVSDVYKRMVQQSKRMARMGGRIGKKGARARKRYQPIAASRDAEGL